VALILLGLGDDPLLADWNGDGLYKIDDVVLFMLSVRDGRCITFE